jgi:hypothetical protein
MLMSGGLHRSGQGARSHVFGVLMLKPQTHLSARIKMLIEIALHADCDCVDTLQDQDERARDIGLVGVEIDAARTRTSFDVHAQAAIRLACALRQGDASAVESAKDKALAVGLSACEITEIAIFIDKVD